MISTFQHHPYEMAVMEELLDKAQALYEADNRDGLFDLLVSVGEHLKEERSFDALAAGAGFSVPPLFTE